MEWSRLFFNRSPGCRSRLSVRQMRPGQNTPFQSQNNDSNFQPEGTVDHDALNFEPWENMEGLKRLHLVIRTRESLWLLPRKCWRAWSRIQHLPGPRLAAMVVRGSWVCMAETNISCHITPCKLYTPFHGILYYLRESILSMLELCEGRQVVGSFAFQVHSF